MRAFESAISGLLTVVVLACATPPGELPRDYEISRTVSPGDFELPRAISDLRLDEVQEYDETELGFKVRYSAGDPSRGHADVYIYPILLPQLHSLAHVPEQQQHQLDREIGLVAASQQFRTGPVRLGVHTPSTGVLKAGYLGHRELERGELRLDSWSFLTVSQDLFFKLRYTSPASEMMDADFAALVDSLSTDLRPLRPHASRELGVTITRTTAEIAGEEGCAWTPWLLYGYTMSQMIHSGRYLDTFERELEARSAALDVFEEHEEKDGRPCPSPYWNALSRARSAEVLREYFWTTHRDPIWELPTDLNLERYQQWAAEGPPAPEPVPFPGVLVRWATDDEEEGSEP